MTGVREAWVEETGALAVALESGQFFWLEQGEGPRELPADDVMDLTEGGSP